MGLSRTIYVLLPFGKYLHRVLLWRKIIFGKPFWIKSEKGSEDPLPQADFEQNAPGWDRVVPYIWQGSPVCYSGYFLKSGLQIIFCYSYRPEMWTVILTRPLYARHTIKFLLNSNNLIDKEILFLLFLYMNAWCKQTFWHQIFILL